MLNYKLLLISLFGLFFLSGCSTPGTYTLEDPVEVNIVTPNGVSVVNEDTKAVQTEDILLRIATGDVDNFSIIHKFGSGDLTTTFNPVTTSGFYRTPTTAVTLEFVSDDVDDTYLGTGAREITITGLNSSWEEVTFTINTNGTTPVTLPIALTRLYRWYVSSSGSYASQTIGSHEGTLTIQELGGGDVWSIIKNSPFPAGQSEIGVYTIPKGKVGYLFAKNVFTDTSKSADLYFFQRCNIDDVTVPYSGSIRLIEREVGVTGGFGINFNIPKGGFVGPCDIGYMGVVSVGSALVSTEFELILVDSN